MQPLKQPTQKDHEQLGRHLPTVGQRMKLPLINDRRQHVGAHGGVWHFHCRCLGDAQSRSQEVRQLSRPLIAPADPRSFADSSGLDGRLGLGESRAAFFGVLPFGMTARSFGRVVRAL